MHWFPCNTCLEERARRVLSEKCLADKLVAIICTDGIYSSAVMRRAFSVLTIYNKTPEGAKREPFSGIANFTSDQDCSGLAQLFSLLPTTFICWRIRQVSRCWHKVTGMAETWQRVDFDHCSFMTAHSLRSFLITAPLEITEEASFVGCSKVEADGFKQLATAIRGKLLRLDMSDCANLKDEALVHLIRTSEGIMNS
jgi:hypothetical protein